MKSYMNIEDNRKLGQIVQQINSDEKKIGTMQRFGYFSIPFPSSYGDKFYSEDLKGSRIEGRSVRTEKRGIFTNPPKKGKFKDAYFNNDLAEEPKTLEKIQNMAQRDHVNYMNRVKLRKEQKPTSNFKPGGPQEHMDYFDFNKTNYEVPITKQKNKFAFIDGHRVITERRGIFTNPPKIGTNSTPGILFSYPASDSKKLFTKQRVPFRAKSAEKNYRKPFLPASLKRNECFFPDNVVYGYGDEKVQKFSDLLEKALEGKHRGQMKFVKSILPGAVQHSKPFSPPKLISTGKETLFSPVYGVPFSSCDKIVISTREKKEYEQKHRKDQFTYNRLMDHSTFSRPITSFTSNLKQEFPMAFNQTH